MIIFFIFEKILESIWHKGQGRFIRFNLILWIRTFKR